MTDQGLFSSRVLGEQLLTFEYIGLTGLQGTFFFLQLQQTGVSVGTLDKKEILLTPRLHCSPYHFCLWVIHFGHRYEHLFFCWPIVDSDISCHSLPFFFPWWVGRGKRGDDESSYWQSFTSSIFLHPPRFFYKYELRREF